MFINVSPIVFARNKLKENLIENYEETRNEALAKIKSDESVEYFDFEKKEKFHSI